MDKLRTFRSKDYNYNFNTENGFFARWGKTKKDDPVCAFSPEIADIEIVEGKCKGKCKYCYKSNGGNKVNYMSLDIYKKLLSKISGNLLQVAFGITDIDANPDFFPIMEHTRSQGIIPNYTTHGLDITPEIAAKTKELCGAVAVSVTSSGRGENNKVLIKRKQKTYESIKMFTDAGMDQVNIHYMISEETYDEAFKIMKESKTDPRLEKLNAIVFLSLKQKGRGTQYNKLSFDKYKKLVDYALDNDIRIGFDSCSAPLFLAAVKERKEYNLFEQISEPCESFLFSIYINTNCEVTPCSFLENEDYEPINVLEHDNFLKDVWHSNTAKRFREELLTTESKCAISNCRMCPKYDIYPKELFKEYV